MRYARGRKGIIARHDNRGIHHHGRPGRSARGASPSLNTPRVVGAPSVQARATLRHEEVHHAPVGRDPFMALGSKVGVVDRGGHAACGLDAGAAPEGRPLLHEGHDSAARARARGRAGAPGRRAGALRGRARGPGPAPRPSGLASSRGWSRATPGSSPRPRGPALGVSDLVAGDESTVDRRQPGRHVTLLRVGPEDAADPARGERPARHRRPDHGARTPAEIGLLLESRGPCVHGERGDVVPAAGPRGQRARERACPPVRRRGPPVHRAPPGPFVPVEGARPAARERGSAPEQHERQVQPSRPRRARIEAPRRRPIGSPASPARRRRGRR